MHGLRPAYVIADTAYDSGTLRGRIRRAGAEVVIRPNGTRSPKPTWDRELYSERNRIERFFGRLKQNRRVATRYGQTARNYLGFVLWCSTLILLR